MIKRVEPLIGLDYMQLLNYTRKQIDEERSNMNRHLEESKSKELSSDLSEVCVSFAIEKDAFHGKNILETENLWIENYIEN